MLTTLLALLAAATVAVPLTRRAGLGSVLGYLVAGILIGPSGFRLITDVEQISSIASLGVIMLLFLIGLELRPQRLWVMRRAVFGLGASQVILTSFVLMGLAHLAQVDWSSSAVLGMGLAMSSTAIVLPMLAERDLLKGGAGRDAFAVLLFQDLAFIPIVAIVPLLADGAKLPDHVPWHDVSLGIAGIALILVGGRFVLPPLFRLVGGGRNQEVFTVTSLFVVVAAAFVATQVGLSASLGAFMAGVLLSDSEYRHELQIDIEPFEGLLLGFFFISVGMSADLHLVVADPLRLGIATLGLLGGKIAVGFLLTLMGRQTAVNATRFAMALPQASEFSLVLFGAAVAVGALSPSHAAVATLASALSMLLSPLLFAGSEAWIIPRLQRTPERPFDTIEPSGSGIIIAGFGRMGQIVGRVLQMHGIPFTALERDPGQVDVVRRFGNNVYFGDPTRPDMLRAAGADEAKLLIVVLDDMEAVLRTVEVARRTFPHLKVLARARNRRHAHRLMDLKVDGLVRETFHSSLALAEKALMAVGTPREAARRGVALFRDHDERNLRETHAIYKDEQQLIQSVQQAAAELESLFEADRRTPEPVESEPARNRRRATSET
ncbi:MAG: glutathione-regulated potassium-efflux system protein KefB [Rhodospirillales bacterium 69-11]|nr:cation:proton antiporter [Rhodospirillales bacterium]OJW24243.1 MAG: glutathione-regulated potassium-efflux system protein KefB [Rhodospirillales bacterium 69-11]